MQAKSSCVSAAAAADVSPQDRICPDLWLFFRAAGAAYALSLSNVSKVLPVMSLRDVPGTAGYVRGLMNVHGQSLPVIDFADLVGVDRGEGYRLDSPILLIEQKNTRLGLLIDHVLGIESLQIHDFQAQEGLCDPGSLFTAVVASPYGQALSVDVAELCEQARLITLPSVGAPRL